MELYIGGCAQGKLQYVLKDSGCRESQVIAETGKLTDYGTDEKLIFYPFHEWFREEIELGRNPEEQFDQALLCHSKLLIISNEVGCGIVPVDAIEREYRERLGRYLCSLAKRAGRVERIICGIGQRIK